MKLKWAALAAVTGVIAVKVATYALCDDRLREIKMLRAELRESNAVNGQILTQYEDLMRRYKLALLQAGRDQT